MVEANPPQRAEMNQVVLPIPPSANMIWRIGRGRMYKSGQYLAWLAAAEVEFLAQGPWDKFEEKTPYRVEIFAAIDRRRDIDNLIKPILDAMLKAGLTPDDAYADVVVAQRLPVGARGLNKDQVMVRWRKK